MGAYLDFFEILRRSLPRPRLQHILLGRYSERLLVQSPAEPAIPKVLAECRRRCETQPQPQSLTLRS